MIQYLKISGIIIVMSFTACTDKKQATEFAKQIVKTYFDKDCAANIKLWNDTIRFISPYGDTTVSSKTVFNDKADFCERFVSKQRFDSSYSFQDYLNDFEIRIYSKEEFTNPELLEKKNEDTVLSETLSMLKDKFQDNDYLFVGDHLKSGTNKSEDKKISHWRSWIKIISKTKKGWKITASLP
jgi:hypothetical protein